jgi:uncharacterized membrane protein YqgA involved in biofilm formation
MPISGTLINVAAVLVGASLGLLLGNRLPERFHAIVLGGLGLSTLIIGIQSAINGNPLIMIGSVLIGGLVGEALRLHDGLDNFGLYLQRRLGSNTTDDLPSPGIEPTGKPRRGGSTVSEAFVTSSLVFCIGPLTILGSIQNGISGNIEFLAVKSLLDGFAALAFTAALGWGVFLSAGTVLIYQSAVSLIAFFLASGIPSRDNPYIVEMTAVGGLTLLGVGLKLLNIKELKLANYLPALAIAPLIVWILEVWPWK